MKKELIGFLPEPGGKPKDDDQQVAGIASLAPSLQQQQLPPATSLDCAPVGRGAMQAPAEGVRNEPVLKQNDATIACSEPGSERKGRKPPGRRAKENGTRLKRGLAVQVMVYPRPGAKAVLVRAAREHHQALSSFLVRAGLEKAARLQGCEAEDLLPQDELEQYL
jgi:hypothetical protein